MMSAATLALIAEIMQMLMTAAASAPAVIEAANTAVALLRSQTEPTAEQEAQIRLALDAANAALQAS